MKKEKIPGFIIAAAKNAAFRFYKISEKILQPPFDKYDFETFEILKKVLQKNSNCIDIGAHKGEIFQKIIKYAPQGKHYAFEPLPMLFKTLKKKYSNRAEIKNIALSYENTRSEFVICTDRLAISGFKERDFEERRYQKEIISVEVKRLDDIIPAGLPITLIKIDVEGAEMLVLKGAQEIISKNKPFVLFEFGLGGSEMYNTTPEEMYEYFENFGMKVSTLHYFLKGKQPLDKTDFCNQFYKAYNYFFIAYNEKVQ